MHVHGPRRIARIPAEWKRIVSRAQSDSRGGAALCGDSKRRENGKSGSDRIRGYFFPGGTNDFIGPCGETPVDLREERFSRGEFGGGDT